MFLKALLVFVPIAIVLPWFNAGPMLVFAASSLAIIPLAERLAKSTERVAGFLGSTVGGLLNASLGNAPEIIIGAFALKNNLPDVVKASITGSILMNLLISPGLAMLVGGWNRKKQLFNPAVTRIASALMMLAAIGLIIPSVFHFSSHVQEEKLSLRIAIVLFTLYVLSLVFTLITHKHLFKEDETLNEEERALEQATNYKPGGLGPALGWLSFVAFLLAIVSERLTGALDPATNALGLSDVFAGVIVVGVLGNVAELFAAIRFAKVDKMDLAMGSTLGAATQVALVVAPSLLFLSYFLGDVPMDLQFSIFEAVAITLAVSVISNLTRDGESNWFEGAMLLAVYTMFAVGIYFLPEDTKEDAAAAESAFISRPVNVEATGGVSSRQRVVRRASTEHARAASAGRMRPATAIRGRFDRIAKAHPFRLRGERFPPGTDRRRKSASCCRSPSTTRSRLHPEAAWCGHRKPPGRSWRLPTDWLARPV